MDGADLPIFRKKLMENYGKHSPHKRVVEAKIRYDITTWQSLPINENIVGSLLQ